MKKNITVLSVITSVVLLSFSGCGMVSERAQNKDFKNLAADVVKEKKDDIIKNNVNEIILEKQFLDLTYDKRLSDVLKELGQLEGRSYFLKTSDIDDITIPAVGNKKNIRINTFDKLNTYIRDVSNYGLFVVKNEFLVNQAKVIEVRDIRSLKSDFSKMGIKINSNKNLKDVLSTIADVSRFNIVFSKDLNLANKDDIYVNYSGENLQGLLDYLSNTLEVYIDVDYDRKMIKFNKYKKKYFDLIISDHNINGTTDNESISAGSSQVSGASSTTKSSSLTNTINITLYTHLTENLTKLFDTGKTENPNNFFTLNKTTGQIMVNATKETMKAAEDLIDQFNNSFNSQVKINLEIYEVLVRNSKNLGIDGTVGFDDGSFKAGITATNNVAANVFSLNKIDGKFPYDMFLSSLNTVGKVVNNNNYFIMTRNHMPYNKKIVTTTNYVKSVKTTVLNQGTTATPITESTQETDVISEGFTVTLLPNIVGENISLNINPNITQLLSMENEVYNNNKITLPKVSVENFSTEIIIKDGEKFIIGSVTTYEKSEDYKGVLPLEDFIIGGNSGGEFLRKETVFVISAEIVKK